MTAPLLTAADLFQPTSSGVGPFGNVPAVPPQGTWLSRMIVNAQTIGLPTTAWQSGAPELSIFAGEAILFASSDIAISKAAQGGLLQTAAAGTVSYVDPDSGQTITIAVTPDPSNASQNPTGQLGWLDLTSSSIYATTRITQIASAGPLAFVNLRGSSIGPFAAGSYHVANVNGATYSNPAPFTLPSSAIAGTGGVVTGVSIGATATVITTQSAHGLTPGESVFINLPLASGVSGLSGVFALVSGVTTNTFQIPVSSSGVWASGGTVYLCTVAQFQADVAGTAGNAAPAAVQVPVTQQTNVSFSNLIPWSGANWESNVDFMNRTVLSLAARSPNGPSQAFQYVAQTAAQLLAAQTSPYTLTNGSVKANSYSNPQTGITTTVVASTTPASTVFGAPVTPGVSQLQITAITNASPAVITLAGPSTLAPGQTSSVQVSGVVGTLGVAVDGSFVATYVSANQISIPVDTTASGAYTGGGSVEGGDLGAIDALIQSSVNPDIGTAVTVSALALPVAISATVVVPQAMLAAYRLAVLPQLLAQLQSYALGGNPVLSGPLQVSYNDILGALEEAGVATLGSPSYVRQIQSLSLNGGGVGAGVLFPSNQYQAVLGAVAITVIGV